MHTWAALADTPPPKKAPNWRQEHQPTLSVHICPFMSVCVRDVNEKQ